VGIIEKAAVRLGQSSSPPAKEAPRVASEGDFEREAPVAESTVGSPPSSARSKQVTLNLEQLRDRGMITPDVGRSEIAEEFRAIKRSLVDHALNPSAGTAKRSNLIMVTSSLPGEGKTFCAINLAMSIAAEVDRTVLLVDADVARPSVLRGLGLDRAEAGLMDILLDRHVRLPDVMLKTDVQGLSILPAGVSHRHATELLASQAMSELLDEIATRYADRIVIFDSPPLLLTTESRVLAAQMGQIVLVVEAEKTTQKALQTALTQIEGCSNISLVYNKSNAFLDAENYGYYSYYK
jgi:protein-tyrosine kinase